MFQIEHISKSYGKKQVLNDVSFPVPEGCAIGILGVNGSGKSTLAKHFNAILLPESGKVYVEGMDTADEEKLYDIRQTVGMVFQNPDNQIVATVVEEDVAFALENLGVPQDEMRRRVDDSMKMAGIYEYRERAPHSHYHKNFPLRQFELQKNVEPTVCKKHRESRNYRTDKVLPVEYARHHRRKANHHHERPVGFGRIPRPRYLRAVVGHGKHQRNERYGIKDCFYDLIAQHLVIVEEPDDGKKSEYVYQVIHSAEACGWQQSGVGRRCFGSIPDAVFMGFDVGDLWPLVLGKAHDGVLWLAQWRPSFLAIQSY